jgi:hypothetical protein
MKFKILTANIAFGLRNIDNFLINTIGHLALPSWSIIVFFLNPSSFKNRRETLEAKTITLDSNHLAVGLRQN